MQVRSLLLVLHQRSVPVPRVGNRSRRLREPPATDFHNLSERLVDLPKERDRIQSIKTLEFHEEPLGDPRCQVTTGSQGSREHSHWP
jgi:hypothetical protein